MVIKLIFFIQMNLGFIVVGDMKARLRLEFCLW